jgi:hypothetical protein
MAARRDNLQKVADLRGLNVVVEADYAENEWVNYDPAQHGGRSRCQMCYETRLDRTAAKARELGLRRLRRRCWSARIRIMTSWSARDWLLLRDMELSFSCAISGQAFVGAESGTRRWPVPPEILRLQAIA